MSETNEEAREAWLRKEFPDAKPSLLTSLSEAWDGGAKHTRGQVPEEKEASLVITEQCPSCYMAIHPGKMCVTAWSATHGHGTIGGTPPPSVEDDLRAQLKETDIHLENAVRGLASAATFSVADRREAMILGNENERLRELIRGIPVCPQCGGSKWTALGDPPSQVDCPDCDGTGLSDEARASLDDDADRPVAFNAEILHVSTTGGESEITIRVSKEVGWRFEAELDTEDIPLLFGVRPKEAADV